MLIRKENLLQKKRRNKMTYKKPELLIPASSLEVLKTAVIFGADAVSWFASAIMIIIALPLGLIRAAVQ